MKLILTKDFQTRGDLDAFIQSHFGTETVDYEMELTEIEAARLKLDDTTTVFGVRVIVKREKTKVESTVFEKPDR